MSEGWEDCPVLPVGWKRREVYRRSGATIGKSDTYYMSPTAERFRSKVELVKYFGDALDLTYFDFKKGIILPPDAKIRRSVKRLSTSSCEVDEEQRDHCHTPRKKAKAPTTLSPAHPKAEKVSEAEGLSAEPLDTLIACCEGCQQWVPGVLFGPRKRRLRFYCAECRAKRRELGRRLNYYKRFGCGECEGCAVAEDCGVCRGCVARNSESGRKWKCVRRRCQRLKELKAEALCRRSSGEPKKKIKSPLRGTKKAVTHKAAPADVTSEDKAGAQCKVPTKKIPSHQQLEKKPPVRKISHSGSLKKVKTDNAAPKAEVVEEEKPAPKPCPPLKEEPVPERPDTPPAETADTPLQLKGSRSRRNNRSCGECEACLRSTDCGSCDFCKDKAKFGGANTLRQKCRWKQCLCFASKRLLPRELLAQGQWADWKEPGYRSSRRRWKENAFASRKVARAIQAARKRKMWQASAQTPEPGAEGPPEEQAPGVQALTGREEEPSRPRTSSTESGREVAGERVVSSPVEESSVRESPRRSPELKPPTVDQALNLKKFLSVMKPYLKGASSSESHERPSVIRETSEWQLSSEQRRPAETTVLQASAISTPAQRETPEREPERIPSTTVLKEAMSEGDAPSHRSVSPVVKQRDPKEKPSSRKAVQCSTGESGLNGSPSQSLSALIKEERTDSMGSYSQPVSPKRPAETEARTPGIPCNSRIVRRESPEQNPGYGRSPPAAITQIFSLGSPYMMMSLEPLLQNFMQDLMLLPLPASWVVCSSLGPDVQLIQLSRKSPVWDAVVQIRPGFFFHVLVRGLAVPLGHRLYRSHPAQLTTVDDVVDLISDLETYRVCAGYPQLRSLKATPPAMAALLPRERSSFCEVLVDKERCFQCAVTI
ncbi:methyl-CpG-binding domain protein 1-like isoform X12 [Pristis pectinata]|uniref:methyl-CpG-binding domain protein 1-like isoform X12 n=1 Tax=Pristis pectinata TaxID=685728 RepID=UPI00223DC388|nr:methyl-CpG-binding domain protein 1-like isoform X12 [Pristis pectinata]